MKKQEAESAFDWLRRHSKEVNQAGVPFVCAHLIDNKYGKHQLEIIGEGDLIFYLTAIVNQIKAVSNDKEVDTDRIFEMLREMYDTIT